MSHAKDKAAWRERKRAAGCCLCCGEANDRDRTLCTFCSNRRNARRKARLSSLKAELLAQGLPVRGRGWNGFQVRPQDRFRGTPEQMSVLGKLGGDALGRIRSKTVTDALLAEVRHLLLDVRSDFTTAQIADVVAICRVMLDRGDKRGYARCKEQHARRARKAAA